MKPQTYDLTTPCTLCGYKIPPREILRTSFEKMLCPQCKQEFAPKMPDNPVRTS